MVPAVYVGGKLILRLRDLLFLLAVSGFIALILNPLVVAVQRRIVSRRSAAVAIVTVSALVICAGLVVTCAYPLVTLIIHLANRLPGYAANAERGKGWIGHLTRRYHVQAWAQHNAPALISDAQAFGKSALAAGKGALSLVARIATIFMLTVFFLLEGPQLRVGILARMPPEQAARSRRMAPEVRGPSRATWQAICSRRPSPGPWYSLPCWPSAFPSPRCGDCGRRRLTSCL